MRNYAIMLHAVFADAVMDGLIAVNPVQLKRLSLPKEDKAKFVPLTVAQVQAWADDAAPHVRAMILAQAGLGLRIGGCANWRRLADQRTHLIAGGGQAAARGHVTRAESDAG